MKGGGLSSAKISLARSCIEHFQITVSKARMWCGRTACDGTN